MQWITSSLMLILLLALASCGGSSGGGKNSTPSEGNASSSTASFSFQGYAIDEFVIDGLVEVTDASTSTVVASTRTSVNGEFSLSLNPSKTYSVVISGGVLDADGDVKTVADQSTNTFTLKGMILANSTSTKGIFSAVTTGIYQYSGGNETKYSESVNKVNETFPILLNNSSVISQSLNTVLTVQNKVGFANVVDELADDGKINGSIQVNAQEIKNIENYVINSTALNVKDALLYACIMEAAGIDTPTISDLNKITELTCVNRAIYSLEGIEQLNNLMSVILRDNAISDVSPLSKLNKLTYIDIAKNKIADISSLINSSFSGVPTVNVEDNCIATLPATSKMTILFAANQRTKCNKAVRDSLIFNAQRVSLDKITILYKIASASCTIDFLEAEQLPLVCDNKIHRQYIDKPLVNPNELVRLKLDGKTHGVYKITQRSALSAGSSSRSSVSTSSASSSAPGLVVKLHASSEITELSTWVAALSSDTSLYSADIVFENGRRIPLDGGPYQWQTRDQNSKFSTAGVFPFGLEVRRELSSDFEYINGYSLRVSPRTIPVVSLAQQSPSSVLQGEPYNLAVLLNGVADKVTVEWDDDIGSEHGLLSSDDKKTWNYGDRLFSTIGLKEFTLRAYVDGYATAVGVLKGSVDVKVPPSSIKLIEISKNIVVGESPYFSIETSLAIVSASVSIEGGASVVLPSTGVSGNKGFFKGRVLVSKAGSLAYTITGIDVNGQKTLLTGTISVAAVGDSLTAANPMPSSVFQNETISLKFPTAKQPDEMWMEFKNSAGVVNKVPLVGAFLDMSFQNYAAGTYSYALMRRDYLSNVFAIFGASGSLDVKAGGALVKFVNPTINGLVITSGSLYTFKPNELINYEITTDQSVSGVTVEIPSLSWKKELGTSKGIKTFWSGAMQGITEGTYAATLYATDKLGVQTAAPTPINFTIKISNTISSSSSSVSSVASSSSRSSSVSSSSSSSKSSVSSSNNSTATGTAIVTATAGITGALLTPNGGEFWNNDESRTITWNSQTISGGTVDLYVLHDDPEGFTTINDPQIGSIINSKNWYKFASAIANTGTYTVNPRIMSGTGNAYRVLVVSTSDKSKFDFSDANFSLNQGSGSTSSASTANALVGSWYFSDTSKPYPQQNHMLITFLDASHYTVVMDVEAGSFNCKDGSEYGTYTWNSSSGELTAKSSIDNNGECGVDSPVAKTYKLTNQNAELVVQESSSSNIVLKKVNDTVGIKGVWTYQNNGKIRALTILDETRYMLSDPYDSTKDFQYGTYIYNSTTFEFVGKYLNTTGGFTTTFKPQNNGQALIGQELWSRL